ncbi:MAG TPA: hypothetical protein VFP89_01010 [Propionibacteriaceae bacterium]|nr:hypothetical protein [Propionibacteriaceae bacterium]
MANGDILGLSLERATRYLATIEHPVIDTDVDEIPSNDAAPGAQDRGAAQRFG